MSGNNLLVSLLKRKKKVLGYLDHYQSNSMIGNKSVAEERIRVTLASLDNVNMEIQAERALLSQESQAQRDHEEKMAIIAHETARENRLAAEAAAKVAATAQEQASQGLDGLLKGLQGNGET